ncbi:tRNA lysidine(34) synthetase TilS [Enterococcus termitis]
MANSKRIRMRLPKEKNAVYKKIYFFAPARRTVISFGKGMVGTRKSDEPIEQPETIKNWQKSSLLINSNTPLPLMIRHRQNGDRIALTPVLTKRLNRLFIDQKTPNSIREKTWVILSDDKEIIWVPDFANSHLSIPKETDKILYRLLYKIKE